MRPLLSLLVIGLTSCATTPEPLCSFALAEGLQPFRVMRPDAVLYGEMTGTGPPLVLLHGGADHRIFHPVLQRLSGEFTVVFYDQRGYGHTVVAEDAQPTQLETDLEDLDAIREQFGWNQVHVLAYSHGGLIGIEYARYYPDRIANLVLLDTYADNEARIALAQEPARAVVEDEGRRRQVAALDELDLSEEERAIREFEIAPHFFHEKPLAREWVEFWLRSECIDSGDPRWRSGRDRVVMEALGEVQAETLVLCGENDRITPLAHSREMAERLPNSRLEVLLGCGHLSYADDPEAFLEAVRRFLR